MTREAVTAVDPQRARAQLRTEVARVTELLRSLPSDRHAPSLGQWDALDVALHLSQTFVVVPALARGDRASTGGFGPDETAESGSVLRDLWDLADFTVAGAQSDRERDPRVLAERIEERAAAFLDDERAQELAGPTRPWLVDGVLAGPAVFACHLLNETVVHGRDVAVGVGRRWRIEPSSAATVLDGFLMPIAGALGSAMVDQARAAGVRACYDLRIRGGGRHFLVFDDGEFSVQRPSHRPVDCHLSVDPVSFLLLAWGRIGQWGAIARGQLLAWGPKPWLGLRLRSLVRNP